MRFLVLLGLLCVVLVSADKNTGTPCYKAKTCVHNAKEKCGVDESGNYRRFFDMCDMMEYTCLRAKKFTRLRNKDQADPLVNKYWCWRAQYCSNEGDSVCGRDRRLNDIRWFKNDCKMFKFNCENQHSYGATKIELCPKHWTHPTQKEDIFTVTHYSKQATIIERKTLHRDRIKN